MVWSVRRLGSGVRTRRVSGDKPNGKDRKDATKKQKSNATCLERLWHAGLKNTLVETSWLRLSVSIFSFIGPLVESLELFCMRVQILRLPKIRISQSAQCCCGGHVVFGFC